MSVTCFIRHEIGPFQRAAFKGCAEASARAIPRCGGDLIGYFLPHEGSNDVGWGLVGFDGMAACERDRARLRDGAEGRAIEKAQTGRCTLRDHRTWLADVATTRNPPRQVTP